MSAEAAAVARAGSGLQARVHALRDEHCGLWESTPAELPALGPPVGLRRHFTNARAARRLIDGLAAEVESLPDGADERRAWRQAVRERLQRFGDQRLGWPCGYRRLLFADDFFEAARSFARQARAFDPELPLDGLWQALRNVWIGNSLQMLLDLPVRLGAGLFAYSMLYPLTDNLLDDPRLDRDAKREFGARFGRRLAGLPVAPARAGEAAVFRLVAQIEEEFPRRGFPALHDSLLAIHGGQLRSLGQHEPGLSDAELLAISSEKGGSSVLADLYLVAGAATPEQERFAFGYGVFLQLLDDLQDAEADAAAGHRTLFTRALERGALDRPAARLARFIGRVLERGPLLAGPEHADRKDLIRRNCLSLLVGAVADRPRLFSRAFRRAIERQWPLTLGAQRRLRRRAQGRLGRAGAALQRRAGARSLLDWMLAQPA